MPANDSANKTTSVRSHRSSGIGVQNGGVTATTAVRRASQRDYALTSCIVPESVQRQPRVSNVWHSSVGDSEWRPGFAGSSTFWIACSRDSTLPKERSLRFGHSLPVRSDESIDGG